MRVMRCFRVLAAVVVTIWAPLTGGIPLPAAAADPCADVEVVFARGTGEPPGIGNVGEVLVDSLRQQVQGRSVGVYAVNYPATEDYVASAYAGVDDMSAHVQDMVSACPGTRMVLGGYSQGAAVVDQLTDATPPLVADHVAAVVLFGNPSSTYAGSLVDVPLPVISPLYAPKTIDLCFPGDPYCSEGGNFDAHAWYVPTGMVAQAATFVASRL